MTAKEELSQYKYAKERVNETLEEYEKYKTRAEKVTSIISDMPRGRTKWRQGCRQCYYDGRFKQAV